MYKKIIFVFLTSLLLNSCLSPKNQISQLWFYTFSDISSGENDTRLNPSNFINLKNDGNYTRYFAAFEYGKWTFENGKLTLTNYKNETAIIIINSLTAHEMQVKFNERQTDNFESQPANSLSGKDPFSKENNLWRIPSNKKESDSEIKHRLLNHLKFWELYFTWALENNIQSIDVRSLPTLIKIYGNGIIVKPYNTIPEKWKSYFFDEEDCRKANSIVEDAFRDENIGWPHTDNKYKAFISVFQQLQEKIKRKVHAYVNTIKQPFKK